MTHERDHSIEIDTYHSSIDESAPQANDEIDSQSRKRGKQCMSMIGVCPIYSCFNGLHVILVSKATLDIICETAFGYKTDSLHSPENELAVAYETLLGLQDGEFIQTDRRTLLMLHRAWKMVKFMLILMIPGAPKLITTSWMYKYRRWFDNMLFTGA